MTSLKFKTVTSGGALFFAFCASSASAADLGPYRPYAPPPPQAVVEPYAEPPIWEGAYIGVNGGYSWTESGLTTPDGWFGGGQVGYNIQRGALVYGVEGDFQGGDMEKGADFFGPGGFGAAVTDVDWFSTIRGRVGLAAGPTLFYATAGVAFADIDSRIAFGNGTSVSDSSVQTGYAVGGGLEWAFAPHLSMKAEYLYMDFGDQTLTGTAPATIVDTNMQTVRVGLNYRF